MFVLSLASTFVAGLVLTVAAPQETEEAVLRAPSVQEWKLLRKVEPKYPAVAVQHRIQGVVRFTGVIGKDGSVERLSLISGHPLLVRAAIEAAQRWVYRPTLLGDKPVRVITQIAVHFELDPSGKPLHLHQREVTMGVVQRTGL